jgi:hypothetical protein
MAGESLLGGDTATTVMTILLIIFVAAIIFIAIYVYTALAWMSIARKTKTPNGWLAWIPVANNVLISMIAEMHWWPVLMIIPMIIFAVLSMIPGMRIIFMIPYYACALILAVYGIMWTWKAFEKVGRPGVWSILGAIVSIVGGLLLVTRNTAAMIVGVVIIVLGMVLSLVLLGIVAWGKTPAKKVKIAKKSVRKRG